MNCRSLIRNVLIAFCVIIGLAITGFVVFLGLALGVNNGGSRALAAELGAYLERFPSPEAARRANEEIRSKRFAGGEWVFGLSQDSHGLWRRGGGTVVVRDSRGHVRTFFGHVCGSGYLEDPMGRAGDLDQFYEILRRWDFNEHKTLRQPGREKASMEDASRLLATLGLLSFVWCLALRRAVEGGAMTLRRALITVLTSTFVFAFVGCAIGFGLGSLVPDFYRGVFPRGQLSEFDPVVMGTGLGLTQGAVGGVIVGLVLVAILAWYETRKTHQRVDKTITPEF